jgi:hypothetical protein
MAVCDYSEKFGYLAVGGHEGTILIFDMLVKIKLAHLSGKHLAEIIGVYFYDA